MVQAYHGQGTLHRTVIYPIVLFLILRDQLACNQGLLPLRHLLSPIFDEVDVVDLALLPLVWVVYFVCDQPHFPEDDVRSLPLCQLLTHTGCSATGAPSVQVATHDV